MARRGQYPPRVERFLPLFRLMRRYIDQGATPNRAAVLVANEHWRTTPSRTWEACVAWLKRNEREHRDKLQRLQLIGTRADNAVVFVDGFSVLGMQQRDPQWVKEKQEVLAQYLRDYDTLMQRFARQKRRASSSRCS